MYPTDEDLAFKERLVEKAAPPRGNFVVYLVLLISLASGLLLVPRVMNTDASLRDHSASDELAGCRDQEGAAFSLKLVNLLTAKAQTQRDIVEGLMLSSSDAPDPAFADLLERAQRDLEELDRAIEDVEETVQEYQDAAARAAEDPEAYLAQCREDR